MADGDLIDFPPRRPRINLIDPELRRLADEAAAQAAAEELRRGQARAALVAEQNAARMRPPAPAPLPAGLGDVPEVAPRTRMPGLNEALTGDAGLPKSVPNPGPAPLRPGPMIAPATNAAPPPGPMIAPATNAAPPPGPRISPKGKIRAHDIYAAGGNELSTWDRVFKTEPWREAEKNVGAIREAEAWEKGRPDLTKKRTAEAGAEAARLRVESDADIAAAQAMPPGKARTEALKAATKKAENAEELLNKAGRANLDDDLATPAAKARADALEAVRKAREGRLARNAARMKTAGRVSLVGAAGLLTGAAVTALTANALRNSKGQSDETKSLVGRYIEGGGITAEEEQKLRSLYDPETFNALTEARSMGVSMDDVKSKVEEDDALEAVGIDPRDVEAQLDREEAEARAATGDPEAARILPFLSGRVSQPMPEFDFGGAAAASAEMTPMPIDYRKPEIRDVPSSVDPRALAELSASGDPMAMQSYLENAQIDDALAKSNALYAAGVQNTASAAGLPDQGMEWLRGIENLNLGEPVPELIPDNMLKRGYNFVADAYAKARPAMQERADANFDNPKIGDLSRYAPYGVLALGDTFLGRPADEQAAGLAGIPYNMGRALYPLAVETGAADKFAPIYREGLRGMGGETLLEGPLNTSGAPNAQDYDRFERERAGLNAEQSRESNSGANQVQQLTLQDLQRLEAKGRLGMKPDGTPYTAVEMLRVLTGPDGGYVPPGVNPAQPELPPDPTIGSALMGAIGMGPGPWQQNLPELTPEEMESLRLGGRFAPGSGNMSTPNLVPPMPLVDALPSAGLAEPPSAAALPAAPVEQPRRRRTIAEELGFGPADAAEPLREDEDVAGSVRELVDRDEVLNPRGQQRPKARTDEPPAPAGLGLDEMYPIGVPASTAPSAQPVLANSTGTTAQRSAAGGTQPNGPVGDFRASREAGLSDDAAAAEEELNWINRQMRDKLGLDATQRGYLAQALIAGGGAMVASDGNFLEALSEGISAGAGAYVGGQQADVEAEIAQAELGMKQENASRDAALDAIRLRVEQAREERLSRAGTSSDPDYADMVPAKIREIEMLADRILKARPNLTYEEADELAMQMVYNREYVGEDA